MHKCKCAVCGITFDRDTIQAVRHGARRYAHKVCYPEGEIVPLVTLDPAAEEHRKLKDYINEKYNTNVNWPLVEQQLKAFIKEYGYTYSGMRKSLEYFYDIKHNPISPQGANHAVGIIPYCYDQAKEYYYKIYMIQQNQLTTTLKETTKDYYIKPPKAQGTKRKLLEWDEENEKF